jgi:hypothetical protein
VPDIGCRRDVVTDPRQDYGGVATKEVATTTTHLKRRRNRGKKNRVVSTAFPLQSIIIAAALYRRAISSRYSVFEHPAPSMAASQAGPQSAKAGARGVLVHHICLSTLWACNTCTHLDLSAARRCEKLISPPRRGSATAIGGPRTTEH